MQKISVLKYLGLSVLVLVAVASIAGNVYLYRKVGALKTNPQMLAVKENELLVAAVGRLMVLPNEQPTIATVTEPEKLKDQAFFASAKNGDKVLIFTNAKKAVLYDPVADKILEVAPLQNNEQANADEAVVSNVNAPVDEADDSITPTPARKKTTTTNDASRQP